MNKLEKLLRYPTTELLILAFAIITRFWRLWLPKSFIFDEVYHAFTAQQMAKGNPAAWEWWNTPPPGVAYEWTHPPLAKEFMWFAIKLFGDNAFAWRFFSAVFGVITIVLIYYLAKKLFGNRPIALLAAFTASLDGLLLVMSRIAMNDMYFVCFSLAALLLFLYNRKLLSGIFVGLAFASKWTGAFGIFIIGLLLFVKITQLIKAKQVSFAVVIKELVYAIFCFLIIPILIYLAAYIPFFMGSHHIPDDTHMPTTAFEQHLIPQNAYGTNWETFIKLQEQMWWYHTGLKAHHTYQSRPWQWVLNMRPVWFYVDYQPTSIANIYAFGNPLFEWFGVICIFFVAWDFFRKRSMQLATILLGYFGFFLPWQASPRIMFYYHYTPAVPFLALAIGYVLNEFLVDKVGKTFVTVFLIALVGFFLFFSPEWFGYHIPMAWDNALFWFPSWK